MNADLSRTRRPTGSWLAGLGGLLLALNAGCGKQAPVTSAAPWFEDVAAQATARFTYRSGHQEGRYLMPEIKGGGVGLLDFDGDGRLDLFCVQGGSLEPGATNRPGHTLFRNLGNWRFEDVTPTAGVAGRGSFGMGCACADYDNDRHVDILVTHLDGPQLYRNNGDGTFTDVTLQAGLVDKAWGMSAAFFDYDQDGYLDLVVANYVRWSRAGEVNCFSQGGLPDYCSPLTYKAPTMASLYHNRGDGTFELVTAQAGLDRAFGNGLGVVCADFDHDGRLDIFIANDASPNQLWMNQGGGRSLDEAMMRGCAVNAMGMSEAGMGVSSADLNNDGWRDLFVTHLVGEANRLWLNTNGYFVDTVKPRGPGATSWPNTSFGVGFFDFDHDGELDLYVANGRVKRGQKDLDPEDRYAEANNLFRGLGDGAFDEIPNAGLAQLHVATSRGAAFGDLDNDGSVDVVVANRDRPLFLLRNIAPKKGHWLGLRVLDRQGHTAIGTDLRIEAGGRTWWRSVSPHESYASSNDPRVHCGLGPAGQVDRVVVRWLGRRAEHFGPFAADRYVEIREGAGTAVPLPGAR